MISGSQYLSWQVQNFKKIKHKFYLLENTSLLGQKDRNIPFLASVACKIFVSHRQIPCLCFKDKCLRQIVVCGWGPKEQKCMGGKHTFLVLNKAVYHCILQVFKTRPKVRSFRSPGEWIRNSASPSSLLIFSPDQMSAYSCAAHLLFFFLRCCGWQNWSIPVPKQQTAPGKNPGLRRKTPAANYQS